MTSADGLCHWDSDACFLGIYLRNSLIKAICTYDGRWQDNIIYLYVLIADDIIKKLSRGAGDLNKLSVFDKFVVLIFNHNDVIISFAMHENIDF
jgi:hypothetical protein